MSKVCKRCREKPAAKYGLCIDCRASTKPRGLIVTLEFSHIEIAAILKGLLKSYGE